MDAQRLWDDPERVEIAARPMDEPRFLITGQIDQTIWSAAVTYRHEDTIRIISVRRARDDEKARYLEGRRREHGSRV